MADHLLRALMSRKAPEAARIQLVIDALPSAKRVTITDSRIEVIDRRGIVHVVDRSAGVVTEIDPAAGQLDFDLGLALEGESA